MHACTCICICKYINTSSYLSFIVLIHLWWVTILIIRDHVAFDVISEADDVIFKNFFSLLSCPMS